MVAHPWTLVVAAAAAAAAAGGGQQRLLCSAPVRAGLLMRWLKLRTCGPGWQGGGSGTGFAWLWQRKAAELFGRRWQGSIDGNVRALAAAHPWMSGAAAVATVAGGGQRRLLCLACVGVGQLTCRLALHARSPGRQGGGEAALALLCLRQGDLGRMANLRTHRQAR